MITCSRKFHICAGHRVLHHESKCAHPHGHNYVIWVTVSANLDTLGRVLDFSCIKAEVGPWLEENWDHGFLVNVADKEMLSVLDSMEKNKHYIMPYNPTAENMAKFLGEMVLPGLLGPYKVTVTEVVIWETENCYATWKLSK